MNEAMQDEVPQRTPLARASIDALFRVEAGRLTRFFASRIRCQAEAQDLTQDAFVRLAGSRIHGDPLPYLRRIARNLLISRFRHDARWRRLIADSPSDDIEIAIPPEQTFDIEAEDVKRQYQRIIDQLPAKTRTIYLMHRLDGLSYAEIAEKMGLKVKSIEYHISSALKSLVRGLDQE